MMKQAEEWEVVTENYRCSVRIDRDDGEPIIKIKQDDDHVWLSYPTATDLIAALQAATSTLDNT